MGRSYAYYKHKYNEDPEILWKLKKKMEEDPLFQLKERMGEEIERDLLFREHHLWVLDVVEELLLKSSRFYAEAKSFRLHLKRGEREIILRGKPPYKKVKEEIDRKRLWVQERALDPRLDYYVGSDWFLEIQRVLVRGSSIHVGSFRSYPEEHWSILFAWAAFYSAIRASWGETGQIWLTRVKVCAARFAYWFPLESEGEKALEERELRVREHLYKQTEMLEEQLSKEDRFQKYWEYKEVASENLPLVDC